MKFGKTFVSPFKVSLHFFVFLLIQGNIALYKPTDQYGLWSNSFSSKAVDGVRQTIYHMCTHTYGGPNPWWRVDLGRVEDVAEVHILNRGSFGDRLNDAEIRVGQLNIKHLVTGPEGNSEFCFPRISMFPETKSRETLIFEGNKIHCFPRDQSLSDLLYSKTKQKQILKNALGFLRQNQATFNCTL